MNYVQDSEDQLYRADGVAPETKADTSGAWAVCAEEVWRLEEGTVKDWKEEIDTMLVFVSVCRRYAQAAH